ncbi:RNA binding protein [Arthrobacter phage Kaylissa]|uniref:RNA binding protein n=1 Tax=Arthrobacter phage Kaylissa TaxID=2835951 RepID=A0AA92N418_9CAUD|nr:hypothetical protein PQE14_gp53 [Arthrobacter phage Kaylissa]QGZ17352.1 RNA binding protein [Arthrobacter phage Powerpuff]QIN94451.1 RNA binding protein [Arthrobacter phage Lego]QIN94543.1 RNA binding protein [Arthrobacter phage YesChef]WGH20765.1 RNA binding protein [Arthrobacter phage JohnDoe]QXO14587.1 RNA binding protein [Arthrobacter phage Kaylissa]
MSTLARTVKQARANLYEAVASEATVTIKLDSGTILTGTVTEHPTLPSGYYLIVAPPTTRRAFHRSEIEEVIFE